MGEWWNGSMKTTVRLICVAALLGIFARGAHAAWEKVPPVDFSTIKPGDFSDDELDIPYYLQHFHELTDAVVEEGPKRGFISKVFWRNVGDNTVNNARVLENYETLAFFYS